MRILIVAAIGIYLAGGYWMVSRWAAEYRNNPNQPPLYILIFFAVIWGPIALLAFTRVMMMERRVKRRVKKRIKDQRNTG